MSRPALLYGNEALLNNYNELVTEKLNAKSLKTSVFSEKSSETCTVGVVRGMEQMLIDIERHGRFGPPWELLSRFQVPNSMLRISSTVSYRSSFQIWE